MDPAVLGVCKAYSAESVVDHLGLDDSTGEKILKLGMVGTTIECPRRCGWFGAVLFDTPHDSASHTFGIDDDGCAGTFKNSRSVYYENGWKVFQHRSTETLQTGL